jgi:hypothetical protein
VSANVGELALRALRANRVFVRMKSVSAQKHGY